MKYFLACCLVLLVSVPFAQTQGQAAQTTNPPYQTPPTFPEGQGRQGTQMPPDTHAPAPQQMSSEQVQARIEERLRTEKRLSEDEISTEVDDNSVVLKGSVANIDQHDLAVRIAQRYAGNREIVDRLELKQRT